MDWIALAQGIPIGIWQTALGSVQKTGGGQPDIFKETYMKKITVIASAFSLCVILIFSITTHSAGSEISADSQAIEITPVSMPVVTYIPIEDISESSAEEIAEEDISLIALVTMAEAEGECEKGKRLVIDTILNRMDSEHFPDTVYDVIYQPYQFSSM